MAPRLVVTLLLTLALAACGTPSPSPLASVPTDSASPTAGASLATSDPPAASPGRPYDAAALLAAMRDSRRPGGVPDQVETDAVAEALSQSVWTWDGEPWEVLSVGGACGADACSLDVAGSTDGTNGADLYSFSVDPASGAVELLASDLHAYPVALDDHLDRAARDAVAAELGALSYVGARWQTPPDDGRYWLAYRSGGEEGAPGVDVLLELSSGEVLEINPV